jgi:2-polyprenyl-3-methyl-5-hydroxy-6-metoxy-1,4-benzoquinol methylase
MDLNEVPQTSFRRHPWEVARAQFFGRVAAQALGSGAAARVLDIGAGDGYLGRALLGMLPASSTVACVDPHYTDRDLQRFASPATPGLSFARTRPGGPSADPSFDLSFDLILMLDVIEHVADDRGFITETVAGALRPGGAVLVSVPAWDILYGEHDLALKHFRRYQPEQCRTLLRSVGLEIVQGGGLFHSLLVPRILQRLVETTRRALKEVGGNRPRRYGGASGGDAAGADGEAPANLGEWRGGALVSAAVTRALEIDTRLSETLARWGGALPGLSYWALCRRASA